MTLTTRVVTNPYSMRVICLLRTGPRRFNEIGRLIESSSAVATSKLLKRLERDGIIDRVVHTLGPPAVIRYSLTKLGEELAVPMADLVIWLHQHEPQIKACRAAVQADRISNQVRKVQAEAARELGA
jgi:DNA-binding HxlR family transcriptional regulator